MNPGTPRYVFLDHDRTYHENIASPRLFHEVRTLENEPEDPVVIPYTELSPDALRGVVESFVLREGTDYGEKDFSLEQKVAHVIRQLERNEARVMFDPNTESVDIQVVAAGMRRT